MNAAKLLNFKNITFGYQLRQPPVIHDLDLSLNAGKVTAILGPNGAGKTTLLHLALGWLKPWQGTVQLMEKPLSHYSRQELGRWMALVPQGEHIPFEYSVLEYLLLGRAPHLPPLSMPGERDYSIAFEALEKVGIENLYNHPLPTLSGGERQLVLVARALTQQPRLLLLDEPTAHLDLSNKSRMIHIIRELHAQGITVLMTTHEPEVVLAVAEDVILMAKGHVMDYGPLEQVLTSENLSKIYGLPVNVITADGRKQVMWI